MCEMQEYLKSLNPSGDRLIFDSEYHLWRGEVYLGIGVWTEDQNVGNSFQTQFVDKVGRLINQVIIPDRWKLK